MGILCKLCIDGIHSGVDFIHVAGSRFALMEIKAILYYLLLNFSLEINGKTEVPLKLKKTPIFVSTRNGMHLQLKLRGKEKCFSNSFC